MNEHKLQVIKRDGHREDFQNTKILRIALASGLNEEEAKEVKDKVVQQVQKKAKNNEIKSIDIRNIFIEELEKNNQYAAGLFKWFEKTKEDNE